MSISIRQPELAHQATEAVLSRTRTRLCDNLVSTKNNKHELPKVQAKEFQEEAPLALRQDELPYARLRASLLDRITDEDPDSREDPPVSVSQRRRECRASLMRDIEALLNAKHTPGEVPEDLRYTSQSLLKYGLPDFTSMSPAKRGDCARILRAVEAALRQFEPRLIRVSVKLENPGQLGAGLRLSVVGLVCFGVEPEPSRFETVLKADRREFIVVGDGG